MCCRIPSAALPQPQQLTFAPGQAKISASTAPHPGACLWHPLARPLPTFSGTNSVGLRMTQSAEKASLVLVIAAHTRSSGNDSAARTLRPCREQSQLSLHNRRSAAVRNHPRVDPKFHLSRSARDRFDQKPQRSSACFKPTDSTQDQRTMGISHGQAYDPSDRRKENKAKGEKHGTEQFGVQVDPCGACERGLVCLA